MDEVKDVDRQGVMHRMHDEWRSEHATWRDEVQVWTEQHRNALGDLERIEARLRDFSAAVQQHGASLEAHERAVRGHEHELADLQEGGLGEQWDPLTPEHDAWVARHGCEREAHGRLKAKSHRILSLLRKLKRATAGGACEEGECEE